MLSITPNPHFPTQYCCVLNCAAFLQRGLHANANEHIGSGTRESKKPAHCTHEFVLSREHRIMLHCVLRMKLAVARNAFAQSRKMLSMSELIEQNSQVICSEHLRPT